MSPEAMNFISRDATETFYESRDEEILKLYEKVTGESDPRAPPSEVLADLLDQIFNPHIKISLTILAKADRARNPNGKPAMLEKAEFSGPYRTERVRLSNVKIMTPGPVIQSANLVLEDLGAWLKGYVPDVFNKGTGGAPDTIFEIWTGDMEYLGRVDLHDEKTNYSATVFPFTSTGPLEFEFMLMRTSC